MKRTDTRLMFRPLTSEIVSLFRSLPAEGWRRPTVAGSWRVRDVAAHMLDTALRRLSFHRDRFPPPAPSTPSPTERDFVAFINTLNASWIAATRRLSPQVLTELYEAAGGALADFVESLPDDAPALFSVSWAGHLESPGWLDIGREFTEVWHHGAQIRDAVDAGPFSDARWLRAVLEIALHALPHSYRDVKAPERASLVLEVSGPAGGTWSLRRMDGAWSVEEESTPAADVVVRMPDATAWKLFFNALSPAQAATAITIAGQADLAAPLLRTRAVIV